MMVRRCASRLRSICLAGTILLSTPIVAYAAEADAALKNQKPAAKDADKSSEEKITVLGRASRIAPASVPLNITQPTSIIKGEFLRNNIIPLGSVDDIIHFQPSVFSQNPNGPGMGKAETMSLRGFQNGQYNMTFDGIPFGNATNFKQTTSALFIAHFLGKAQIDRGPGSASTIGNATFGGTIGFTSREPSAKKGVTLYGTYGSFNTRAGGLMLQSGKTRLGRMVLDLQHEETDTYLSNAGERRNNIMFKDVAELAPETTLTLQMTYNHEKQNTTQGATLEDYARFGNNYGLCNDPKRQCYAGYQPGTYQTDFDYIGIKSRLTSWLSVENQIYTYSYNHPDLESTDASQWSLSANGVSVYNTAGKLLAKYNNDVPGKYANSVTRSFGDTLRFKAHSAYGDVLFGVWADVQKDRRYSYAVNLSKNTQPVVGKSGTAYQYDIKDLNTSLQPYLELNVHPWHGATLNPGIKYTSFTRDYNAAINRSTRLPLNTSQTYHSWQPSIALNQRLSKNWSAYAQVARGFRAPPMAVLQADKIGAIQPETTVNYQVGTVYHGKNWMLSVDGYYINFKNYIAKTQIQLPNQMGTNSTYSNSDGAIFKGIEAEGQYVIGRGFSLYGNYSVNDATYKKSSVHVASSPSYLAAAGLLFEDQRGAYFSLMGKFIGPNWGLDSVADSSGKTVFANQYRVGSNATADLAMGWHIHHIGHFLSDVTPSLKVSNLFNNQSVSAFSGNQSSGNAPLYWRMAGRSIFFNLTATYP